MVRANIQLFNTDDQAAVRSGQLPASRVRHMDVEAVVDSGAYMLCINENIRLQLGLAKLDEQTAQMADGSLRLLEVVGPIEVRFENRRTSVDAMVLPADSEVLLGAIPLEGLDVCINPREQTLTVNPASPYIARKALK